MKSLKTFVLFLFFVQFGCYANNILLNQFLLEVSSWPNLQSIFLPKEFHQEYETKKELISYSEEPLIPKIIHQIWIGPKPFPEILKVSMESWKLHHPDWDYKLWTDEDVKDFELYCGMMHLKTIGNSVIGARQKHPVLIRFMEELKQKTETLVEKNYEYLKIIFFIFLVHIFSITVCKPILRKKRVMTTCWFYRIIFFSSFL